MGRLRLLALLICACAVLGGCGVSGEVENQAYVLVLGLDRSDDGQLTLTARVPQVGGRGGGQDEPDGSDYLTFSASGDTFVQALEGLQWATPRELNLSHIKLAVASEALARELDFGGLIGEVVETPHLYATARFAVCEGSAAGFIAEQAPVIGTRLSSELEAMLEHYARHGYIPDSSLAEVYYANNSIYSDPVAMLARSEDAAEPASLPLDAGTAGADVRSPAGQRFGGAALFREGRLVGRLGTEDALCLSLILGSAKSVVWEAGGRRVALTPKGAPEKTVELAGDVARLGLSLFLTTPEDIPAAEVRRIEEELEDRISALIAECQRLGAEPFGFSEVAAAGYLTVPQWLNSGWRERYAGAEIYVSVKIDGPGLHGS